LRLLPVSSHLAAFVKIFLSSPSRTSLLHNPVARMTDHAVVHRDPVEDLRLPIVGVSTLA
jgi:hypothetical protein